MTSLIPFTTLEKASSLLGHILIAFPVGKLFNLPKTRCSHTTGCKIIGSSLKYTPHSSPIDFMVETKRVL
jgi:hypothetical protein